MPEPFSILIGLLGHAGWQAGGVSLADYIKT